MTEQEAIGYLKTLPNRIPLKFFTDDGAKVYDEFSQVVTSALEKQIPKKRDEMMDLFGDIEYNCRVCGQLIEKNYYAYCPTCGQKLDWSEEE